MSNTEFHPMMAKEIKRGKLIVLEGVDGIGKTTIAKELTDRLCREGIEARYTREPGGLPVTEGIRMHIFKYGHSIKKSQQFYLFHACRIIHFLDKIKPLLDKGIHVICDRFYLTSIVYQKEFLNIIEATSDLLGDYEDVLYSLILNPEDINDVIQSLNDRGDETNSYDPVDVGCIKERVNNYIDLFNGQEKMPLLGEVYIFDVNRDLQHNINEILLPVVKDIIND